MLKLFCQVQYIIALKFQLDLESGCGRNTFVISFVKRDFGKKEKYLKKKKRSREESKKEITKKKNKGKLREKE